jgi:hypothetical protein
MGEWIVRLAKSAVIWIVAWFRHPDDWQVLQEPGPETADHPEVVQVTSTEAIRTTRTSRTRTEKVRAVTWNFRDDILDRLDEYFYCLRKVRRADPDAYDLFARVGLSVPAMYHEDSSCVTTPSKAPGHGGILGPRSDDPEKWMTPSFIYFQKLALPPHVEASALVYRLTAVFDDRRRHDGAWDPGMGSFPEACHFAIEPNGTFRLLREECVDRQTFTPKTQKGRKKDPVTFAHRSWQYPQWLRSSFTMRDTTSRWSANVTTVEDFAVQWLKIAIGTSHDATHSIVIRVKHRGMVATFGIILKRAPYFFRDREKDPAVDGKRRRIFHSVIEHTRILPDSRTVTVRAHYRGARTFVWQSYAIHIVAPANNWICDFPIAGHVNEDKKPDGMIGTKAVAQKIVDLLEAS